MARRVQRQQRGQAVPGTAQREALENTEQRQQQDGPDAQGVVGGQQRHADGGGAQHEQRHGEFHATAPVPLDGHEQGGTEGPGQEREGKNNECRQHAFQASQERKEHVGEHQHRGDAEHEEIEIFRGAADHHAHGDLPGRHLGAVGGGITQILFHGSDGRRGLILAAGHDAGSLCKQRVKHVNGRPGHSIA